LAGARAAAATLAERRFSGMREQVCNALTDDALKAQYRYGQRVVG
jgi:hypothetical protein